MMCSYSLLVLSWELRSFWVDKHMTILRFLIMNELPSSQLSTSKAAELSHHILVEVTPSMHIAMDIKIKHGFHHESKND